MRLTRVTAPLVVAATVALGLGACSSVAPTPLPKAAPSASVTAGKAPTAQSCTNAVQSYAPDGALPAPSGIPSASTMGKIKARGRLIAGVSADTRLLGSRNPLLGRIEGFDIDLVQQIADAILGPNAKVELRVITAADRLPVLQNHQVDVVVRNMTITCDRWKTIAFSAEYYRAGQKILIRKGSTITGLASLAGKRVCAPTGTSSLDNLVRLAPKAIAVPATTHTECLVNLQQGKVEAITGDDTVLAGLASQDPYAVVLSEKAFTAEPYGVGIAADQVDLVKFVNTVLENDRTSGDWTTSYNTWLAPELGKGTGQPAPSYGRPTP
ncbi:putative transporter substrate-binding protein [Janibacter sp. HTCC2649]|uniref:glutamate ABC transporter substrate-binding protein n=1 Tax=Janibacter sp. HTCC2649 TaxID=313589 RepID=UPI000067183E|nr:glutamate ABC transporter substrate-binding protein [Janibacter sp. HTCC2649]EAP97883.1 putative transporter substrate-binding protein [Janibacter sp. HTCC2649]